VGVVVLKKAVEKISGGKRRREYTFTDKGNTQTFFKHRSGTMFLIITALFISKIKSGYSTTTTITTTLFLL
jgi:hypothetical protein